MALDSLNLQADAKEEVEIAEPKMNSIERINPASRLEVLAQIPHPRMSSKPWTRKTTLRLQGKKTTSRSQVKKTSKESRTMPTGSTSKATEIQKAVPIISIEAKQDQLVKDPLPFYLCKDYKLKPSIIYIKNKEKTNEMINSLFTGPVTMDLEWCITFYRTAECGTKSKGKTAVVQIANGAGLILIIQVNGMCRFSKCLQVQAWIENLKIAKVGVNILNDGKKLFRDYGIMAKNLVELGSVALVVDPKPIAKCKILVECYCSKILDKGPVQISDCEKPLSVSQREYAVNDIHSLLMVYNELLKLGELYSCTLEDVAAQYTSKVGWSIRSGILSTGSQSTQTQEGMQPQYLQAYESWHQRGLSLEEMCLKLSLKSQGSYRPIMEGDDLSLKPGTMILYIIAALQNDSGLEHKLDKLVELVQMDLHSWSRHREWVVQQY
ncbi:hypothetical protein D9756_010943 [Leucocoprinus leucothites]|uniref:3'-5' exonuclease domain-containing protein n=1 Tax=Leucocoprinus leucothites TaxID=201217 RepID=A0A8H5FS51_9AGAR|nr:hypothetical protein D9756_010943 [Leucoagaricus leucothites]